MVKARKYIVKKHFEGAPKRIDFEVVEYELPPLENGEILAKVEWISVDPYLRNTNLFNSLPYDQYGFQVAVVEDSKNPIYPIGTRVVSHKGWCDYMIINPNTLSNDSLVPFDVIYKLPNLKGLSPSLGVGAVGMPGATAYMGLLRICKPQKGETVVVTGAAGAVGSIVGQLAKIKGCKVIGFAGSPDKVKWLEKELGFDKAFNYKTVDVEKALKESAPQGIDCYFDNVGGDISNIIINQMNKNGRIAIGGSISSYNEDSSKVILAPIWQPPILMKELTIQGVHVSSYLEHWPAAFSQIVDWIKNGQLLPREHITEGFDNIPDAFIGMLAGNNFGKAVVKV